MVLFSDLWWSLGRDAQLKFYDLVLVFYLHPFNLATRLLGIVSQLSDSLLWFLFSLYVEVRKTLICLVQCS